MTFREFLFSVIIPILSGLLGGGAVSAYIDWRRFQKEQQVDRLKLDVNIIQALLYHYDWEPPEWDDGYRLYVYDNNLIGSVHWFDLLVEFALVNLTEQELIITNVSVIEPPLPKYPNPFAKVEGKEAKLVSEHPRRIASINGVAYYFHEGPQERFWDAEGYFDISSKEERSSKDYITIPAKGTLAIAYRSYRSFFALRRLETPPEAVTVAIKLASGQEINKAVSLQPVRNNPWRERYRLKHPKETENEVTPDDDPF